MGTWEGTCLSVVSSRVMWAQAVHLPSHYLPQFKRSTVLINLSKTLATHLDNPVPFKILIYEQNFFFFFQDNTERKRTHSLPL